MPGAARCEIVAEGEVGAYHCMTRCVRRAFLCGNDILSGKNFEHRKEWIRTRLQQLASAFSIDVGSYAVMDNHLHVIVRLRPDIADKLSSEEVTRHWRSIFSKRSLTATEQLHAEQRIQAEAADPKLVAERRRRLSNVSWFMRCLCESIARRANQEDGCKGRFWEGRFKSQALLDDAALLACSAYVDLNPIRAGIAKTPETSRQSAVAERIAQRQKSARKEDARTDGWLSPIATKPSTKTASLRRASQDVWLSMELDDYLKLLDWSGRQIRADKRGAIPADMASILDRLKVQPASWIGCISHFGRWFKHAAGSPAKLEQRAAFTRRRWLQGIRKCSEVFL